jgi:bifunctional DNase/RNase
MKQVYPHSIQSGMSQSGSCILMLHEPMGGRQVPIIIGSKEAQSILLALKPEEMGKIRRPMTHQLMVQVMEAYGLNLKQVTIDRVLEGVFFSTLHLTDGFNDKLIDSRTTDAVTLALLTKAPIYMEEQVLEEAGVRSPDATESTPQQGMSREALEEELHRCEENEDYERAAEIQALLDNIKQ